AYIFSVYTGGAASGSLTVSVPTTATPGSYEVRLFAHNGFTLLATTPLTVTAPTATLSVAPTSAAPGDGPTATWSGISTPTSTDWVGLFLAGAPNSAYIFSVYTGGAASGSLTVSVPTTATPGSYEVRLFAHNGFTLLATTPLTVHAQATTHSPDRKSTRPNSSHVATSYALSTPTSTDWYGLF